MHDEIISLVKGVSNLVSLPEVSLRVNAMVDDPNASAESIGKVIAQDPALAVRLLKMANSPFYGLATEVDTVSRAVSILGTQRIRDLVLSTAASRAFDGIPNDLISMQDFWHHSLYCGLLAQTLARETGKVKGETLFLAGLLHDIGQLVMFNRLPEKSHEAIVLLMEGSDDLDMYQAERHVFGFDHMQVGAELIKNWNLPHSLKECIAYHHEPSLAQDYPYEAALINIANSAAVMAELHSFSEEDDLPKIDPHSWEITGLNKDVLVEAVNKAQQDIAEIEAILFPQDSISTSAAYK